MLEAELDVGWKSIKRRPDMKTRNTHTIIFCLLWLASGQVAAYAAAGSPHLVQAVVGFNQPNNLGLPCAGCFGLSGGTVVFQPNQFVSSGSEGLYYAVFQEDGWSGSLSASFQLTGAGSTIQSITVNGSIVSGQGVAVLSANASIPQTTFSGRGALMVTTTATPSDGSAPITLMSWVEMEVAATGPQRFIQLLVGVESEFCGPRFGECELPEGAIAVQPAQFYKEAPGGFYSVFQAGGWLGGLLINGEVVREGKVLFHYTLYGGVSDSQAHSIVWYSESGAPLGVQTGSGTLRVTVTATPQDTSAQPFTLTSTSAIEFK
jgi:hypothetical protein